MDKGPLYVLLVGAGEVNFGIATFSLIYLQLMMMYMTRLG
jgi:hypothetical protein